MGRIFGFMPQTIQLGARSLFRKRTRAALTLVALALPGPRSSACKPPPTRSIPCSTRFLAPITPMSLSTSQPQAYQQVQQVLASVPGVAASEPLFRADIQTQWGDGLLTGVEPNAQLYQKKLVEGRWFTDADQNVVVISQDAAKKSGLKIGDTIAFHNSLYSATWKIIGMADDHNNPTGLGVSGAGQ